MPFGRVLARLSLSLLLAGSGAAFIAADRERWWPGCRWGDFDSGTCMILQDHLFDADFPSNPWTPIGSAAQWSGLAMILVAAALAILPWLIARRLPVVAGTASAVLALPIVPIAAAAWLSGQAGSVVTPPLLGPTTVVAILLGPPALIAVMCVAFNARDLTRLQVGSLLLLGSLLGLGSPLGRVFLGPIFVGYVSYDTTPWTGAVAGTALVVAAPVAWLATGRHRLRNSMWDRARPAAAEVTAEVS